MINTRCRTLEVDYWIPVCLTSISEEGYINMYYRNISPCIGLLLLSSKSDNIADNVMMCQKIEIVGWCYVEYERGTDH